MSIEAKTKHTINLIKHNDKTKHKTNHLFYLKYSRITNYFSSWSLLIVLVIVELPSHDK